MLNAALDDTTILIGDNSDNEDSLNVVNSFASDKIIYHKNAENLGADGNIHALFERVTSGYVFCMADDANVKPHALARIAEVIRDKPNIGVVSTPFISKCEVTNKYFLSMEKVHPRIFKSGKDAIVNILPVSSSFPRMIVKREAIDLDMYKKHIGKALFAVQMIFGSALQTHDAIHIDEALVEVIVHNTPTWEYPDDYGIASSLAMIYELTHPYSGAKEELIHNLLMQIPHILLNAGKKSQQKLIDTVVAITKIPEVLHWSELDTVLSWYKIKLERK